MPVDRKDVEVTREMPTVMKEMEKGKFYTMDELFKMEYGMAFDAKATEDIWAIMWSQWTSLNALLVALVETDRLVTAVRREDQGKTITLKNGKTVTFPPTVLYGLP